MSDGYEPSQRQETRFRLRRDDALQARGEFSGFRLRHLVYAINRRI
jgi:hypothetical protein